MPGADTPQVIDQFATSLSDFAEQLLRPFLASLDERSKDRPTEINDPVWGTIVLEPTEVLLLDSPVLQRLRRIRQLGVVHLVFPGAMHTRFDHSIGIVNRVTALIQAVNVSARRQDQIDVIDAPTIQLLRIAALCHDIGHGFMSHVSEKAIDAEPRINALKRAFTSRYRVEDPHLSEMAAFFLVRSPAFSELLEGAWALSRLPKTNTAIAEFVSDVIVGRTVSDDIPLLHELVSGPYDADKLDYLTRDAVCCGVPKIVDIPRLIQKIRIVRQGKAELLREIADRVQGGENRLYSVTAVAASGASTLDELALARALLHDKVYRHQKVRAAEAMVASAVLSITSMAEQPELLPLQLHDESFLDLDTSALKRVLRLSNREHEEARFSTAVEIVSRLRRRDLFVRAFTWSQTPLTIGQDPEEEQTERLHELLLHLRRAQERGQVAARIASNAQQILKLTGGGAVLEQFRGKRLASYVWIDPPAVPKGRALLTRAYLLSHDGHLRRFSDAYPDTEGWSNQYLVNREIGYVFCPRSLAPAVHLAAEELIRTEFRVRVNSEHGQVDGRVDREVSTMRRLLASAGYYNGKPTDLLPLSPILGRAGTEQRLDDLVHLAGEYSAPISDEQASPFVSGLTRRAVIDFLQQFRQDRWIEEALTVLTRVRILRRADVVSGVSAFLQNNPDFRGGHLCSLGGPKDSSAVHTYVAVDIAASFDLQVCSISDLPPAATHVLFVDDFIGSGRQAVDIMEAWLGEPRSEHLGEERTRLPESVARTLRDAAVAFVFTAGFEAGAARLRDRLTAIGMENRVFTYIPEDQLPFAFGEGLFGDATEEFKEECTRIGIALLTSTGTPPKLAENRALGYGNRGLLLVFPFNTPAQTLTVLWGTGDIDGVQWKPLFPRRRKR